MPGLSLSDQPLKTPKPVKPPSEDQLLSQILSNPAEASSSPCPAPKDCRKQDFAETSRAHAIQTTVRKASSPPDGGDVTSDTLPAPAHPSSHLVAQLNEQWRVVDDPLQWILQKRKGKARNKSSGWQGRSFCRTREALLRCIREYCGDVAAENLDTICVLPDFHPDWEKSQ